MLVVSRRPGQSILIGPDIEVFVLDVDGSQTKIGMNAPRTIRILRRELLVQVESENRRAVGSRVSHPQTLLGLAQALKSRPDEADSTS